jgi:hypothetical protein
LFGSDDTGTDIEEDFLECVKKRAAPVGAEGVEELLSRHLGLGVLADLVRDALTGWLVRFWRHDSVS